MNKWLELFLGLILVVVAVAEWGLDYTGLNSNDLKNLMRFYPRFNEGSGYFIAILRKN